MPITIPEPVSERGKKDARRHRQKQRDAIRKNLPEIIAEEAIITKRKGKVVKIPIRSLDIPRFRPGTRKKGQPGGGQPGPGGGGIGGGPGKPGGVIGRRPGPGQGGPKAGNEPGQDYIESDVDLEELIEMMLEDLGLPKLQQKDVAELEVSLGFKLRGLQRSGPRVLLDPKRSSKGAFGRFWVFLDILMEETGRDELTCYSALKQVDGNLGEALELLNDPNFTASEKEVEPFAIYHEQDLRYHKIIEDIKKESNALVIAMMDVSGSMTTTKKYLARSLLFWLVEFLRTLYTRVEIRFIIHHSTARLVPEEEFFHTMESGGTRSASAYELANGLIETQYPTNRWNVYAFHFSDGEDFEPKDAMEEVRKLFEKGINMFGYGEIRVDEYYRSNTNMLPAFKEAFPVEERWIQVSSMEAGKNMNIMEGKDNIPFLGVVIEGKEYIWPALREFLKKDRWLS